MSDNQIGIDFPRELTSSFFACNFMQTISRLFFLLFPPFPERVSRCSISETETVSFSIDLLSPG